MAEVVQETTAWDFPNHTYLLEGSKMLAYIKAGTKKPIYLKHPMSFDKRGRKFIAVKKNPFTKKLEADPDTVEVAGSKGAVYLVNKKAGTCTCAGWNFRGHCRHLEG